MGRGAGAVGAGGVGIGAGALLGPRVEIRLVTAGSAFVMAGSEGAAASAIAGMLVIGDGALAPPPPPPPPNILLTAPPISFGRNHRPSELPRPSCTSPSPYICGSGQLAMSGSAMP